jgi:NifU-like protein involved in Fe-S cluster formation
MSGEFDKLLKELEQSIMEDMKKTHSERIINHFLNPRNLGEIAAPDGLGRVTSPWGDTMIIY